MKTENYGKSSRWQLIAVYLLIGGVVYALVYYFFFAKKVIYDMPGYSVQSPVEATATPAEVVANAAPPVSENIVTLNSTGFSPQTLTIKAGETVTWVNRSGKNATVNSSPHPSHVDYPPLNLGSFADGETLSLAFPKPGTYSYHDHLDATAWGTITVE